jgi:hypothetical protein
VKPRLLVRPVMEAEGSQDQVKVSVREGQLFDPSVHEIGVPSTSHIENSVDRSCADGRGGNCRLLDWSEQDALQDGAVVAGRPVIEVGDVSMLRHSASLRAAGVRSKSASDDSVRSRA